MDARRRGVASTDARRLGVGVADALRRHNNQPVGAWRGGGTLDVATTAADAVATVARRVWRHDNGG